MRLYRRFIYFEDTHGYIKAHYILKNILYVDELVVYKCFRGQGFGKQMAMALPFGTELLASTILDDDGSKESVDLVSFYRSCGFTLCPDKYNNPYMVKTQWNL